MTIRLPRLWRTVAGPLAFLLFAPGMAQAHVKWFCGRIDASLPPLPLDQVLTPLYLTLFVVFTAIVANGALLDALIARFVPGPIVGPDRSTAICGLVVRVGVSIYAFCLWRNLAIALWAEPSDTLVLTPDVYGTNLLVGYVQLGIAVTVLVPRLSLVAAFGLMVLFAIGIAKFGLFYMIDYLFFPGLAAFVALGDPLLEYWVRLRRHRVPILIGSLSLSLMWTAVEKFLYPQWTISVLVLHPGLTAGYSFATVATIAGYVEFSLAFYLLAGREILGRIGAILLMIVFIVAMPEFGMLDVIGHIPVIVILLVALVTGETPLQISVQGNYPSLVRPGLRVGGAFALTMSILMALYYALHAISVWVRA